MTLYSYVAPYTQNFRGNQDVTITSINESGGILCSETTGEAPFLVQFSGSAITATGTDSPYEDLEFTWDLGDDSGAEVITDPCYPYGSVDLNVRDQPETSYCYETPGTYTVSLRVRGKNGPFFIAKYLTVEITVTARSESGGKYYASTSAEALAGTNAGTLANPFNTIAAINTALATGGNKVLLIERGNVFDGGTALNIWGGAGAVTTENLLIDAYGTGALPIINVSSGTVSALRMQNGAGATASPKNKVVISRIKFTNSGTNDGVSVVALLATGHASAQISNIYLNKCEIENTVDNAASSNNVLMEGGSAANVSKIGLWRCTLKGPSTMTHPAQGGFIKAHQWFFMVGCSVEGDSPSGSDQNHHLYPIIQNHSLHEYIDFRTGPNRNYCINLNWNRVGTAPEIAQYHVIAHCNGTGTKRFHDASNGSAGGDAANDPAKVLFDSVICAENDIHGFSADGPILFSNGRSYTHRWNNWWGNDGGHHLSPSGEAAIKIKIYDNKFHRGTAALTWANIINMPSSVFTSLHLIKRNIIVDLRAVARAMAINYLAQAGADIDDNQYYVPNDSDAKYLYDNTTAKSLAEQQAAGFDLNSTHADPGWTDAANGDFS